MQLRDSGDGRYVLRKGASYAALMEIILENIGETESVNNRFSFSGYQKA